VAGTPTSALSFRADVATVGALERERHVRDLVLMTRICQSYEARSHINDDAIAHVSATPRATTRTSTRMWGTRSARARPTGMASWWCWRSVVWVAGRAMDVALVRWYEAAPTRTATAAVAARCPCLHLVLNTGWYSAASVHRCEALVPDASTSPSSGARSCTSTSTCASYGPTPKTLRSIWTPLGSKRTRRPVHEGHPVGWGGRATG
jgi:hypothetical protein